MNLPVVVDIGIGLVLIYLTGALLVSATQELIASLLRWRSKHLKESVLQMMLNSNPSDPQSNSDLELAKTLQQTIYNNPLVQSMNHTSVTFVVRAKNSLQRFIQQKNKSNNTSGQEDKNLFGNPSYISSETFATALIQQLKDDLKGMLENPENAKTSGAIKRIKRVIEDSDKIPKSFKETLTALADRTALKADEADNKLLMFQKEIETWFDRSMDRASGVYKRNTQLLCFCLGLAIAVFFNIDSIYIAQRLAHDSTLRTALVAGATTIIQGSQTSETNSQNNPSTQAKTIDQKILLKNINTVLGSADAPIIVPLVDMNNAENLTSLVTVACPATNPKSSDCEKKEVKAEKFLSASLGWIITTFAIYMGAPFWFDILNKLVNVRSTGKKSQ